jgi:hypothetical protein
VRRSATGILLLAAIFELVASSRNFTVNIGSFHIAQGSLVFDALPVLVAFLFMQLSVDANKVDQLMSVYGEAFKLWSEQAKSNDLDVFISGPIPLYWNTALGVAADENEYTSEKITRFTSGALTLGVMIGVFAFEAHAYYVLFRLNFVWSVSVSCSLAFLIIGVAILWSPNV